MSKAYKGKTCVYCCVPGSSGTGDHVVARTFFLEKFRSNLPKVPACEPCNSKKSELEHYLATVLPFSNHHQESRSILNEKIPNRLAKNVKLYQVLQSGAAWKQHVKSDGTFHNEMTLPLDGLKMEMLFKMIAQGLSYFHWNLLLPHNTCDITGGYLIPEGVEIVERLLSMNAGKRVKEVLGGGAFEYEGVQATDRPEITIWRMSLYGALVGGDEHCPSLRVSNAYVTTAPSGKALPINS